VIEIVHRNDNRNRLVTGALSLAPCVDEPD